MRCHVPSCGAAEIVMFCHAGPFPPGCRRGPPAGLRRGSVSVMRASFQAKGGTGVSLFCARFACGRGRVSAPARFARLIARARRRTHLARRFPPGLFSGPCRSLSAETPKGGPGSRLSLLSFYTMPPNVKPIGERKMKIPEIFHETRAAGPERQRGRDGRPGCRTAYRPRRGTGNAPSALSMPDRNSGKPGAAIAG